jgi:hypothetical protein
VKIITSDDDLDDLISSVGEVLHRQGFDLAADEDAHLVRVTVEETVRMIEAKA